MTKEEALIYIEEWLKDKYALNDKDRTVLKMAAKALKKESVLDKIKAKINDIDLLTK